MQLLDELVAERGRVDALRPAGKCHVQVLADLDLQVSPVEVGEDLRVELTGWARLVYAGALSDEFVKELNATE